MPEVAEGRKIVAAELEVIAEVVLELDYRRGAGANDFYGGARCFSGNRDSADRSVAPGAAS